MKLFMEADETARIVYSDSLLSRVEPGCGIKTYSLNQYSIAENNSISMYCRECERYHVL